MFLGFNRSFHKISKDTLESCTMSLERVELPSHFVAGARNC